MKGWAKRIPRTVIMVMLTALAVGLTGLLAESICEASWVSVVAMTATAGVATYLQRLFENYQSKQKRAKGILENPTFVEVGTEDEALAVSNSGANDDKVYWWPEVDSSESNTRADSDKSKGL